MAVWLAAAGLAAVWAAPAGACDIPVFRFALEYWQADAYEAVVFHRGPLTGEARSAVRWLRENGAGEPPAANYAVRAVDLADRLDAETALLWKQQADAQAPWIVLRYPEPHRPGPAHSVWAGPLTMASARAVVDSPARREIARRLVAGETAVWVLLEGGDPARDAAAAAMLQKELKEAQARPQPPELLSEDVVEIPPGAEADPLAMVYEPQGPPLRIAFSLLRLSAKDPAEAVFVNMLLKTEPDLATKHPSQPMAFPVFGRGRALCALVGKGINRDNVLEIVDFLVGGCSCEVKQWSPGTDLLMRADWDEAPAAVVEAAGPAAPAAAAPPTAWARPPRTSGGLIRNVLIAVGFLVVAALVVAVVAARRAGRS